nr:hypothetical protein [Tanacetum cinerariifolium]
GEKIKESKLLIDELDLPCDFLPPSEYDSFISQDFSMVDALPSTNNEDKVFNPGILIQENPFEIITCVVQDKKLAISNASLVIEDFDPPFYEPLFFKEVPRIKRYIDTKPNRELIHYCLKNPPYKLGWNDKSILDSEGNPTTATERVFDTYKNVEQEIRDQLNAKAEAVQIILTG